MSHLDDGLIQELLDGEVPSSELAPIQAHLASCAECTTRLDEARGFASASDEMIGWLDEPDATTVAVPVAAPDIAPQRTAASWPRNVAWAASLMLAVGLGYTARGGLVPPAPVTPGIPVATPTPSGGGAVADDASANALTESAAESPSTPAALRRATAVEPAPTPPAERDAAKQASENVALGSAEDASRQASESEVVPPRDELAGSRRERADAAPVERRMAPPAASAAGAGMSQLVAREQVAAKASEARATLDTVGTPAGTLFRIDGLELVRTELSGDEVRLVYTHPDGEVTLVQRRVGTQMAWHLEAPPAFPEATLRELRNRVK